MIPRVKFEDQVERFKVEIFVVNAHAMSSYVYLSHVTSLAADFHKLYRSLSDPDSHTATPGELYSFSKLSDLMKEMMELFNSLSEASFLRTVSENGVRAVPMRFKCFREQLISLLSSLKILPKDVFVLDEKTEREFCVKDLLELKQRLNACDEADKVRGQIQNALTELKASERKHDVITKEELEEEMKDLASLRVDLHNDIVVQEQMRANSYSQVFAGYQKSTGMVVAVRKILVAHMMKKSFGIFKRYIETLYNIQHPAFVKMVGASWGVNSFSIVGEYIPRGNLADRLRSKNMPLDANKLTMVALGVASGMAYLHAQGMSHNCLKTRHILLDADDFPCIYGLSTAMWHNGWLMRMFASPKSQILYFAPEVLNGSEPTQKSDVYSYGMILWEMVTREIPFEGMSETEVAFEVGAVAVRLAAVEALDWRLRVLFGRVGTGGSAHEWSVRLKNCKEIQPLLYLSVVFVCALELELERGILGGDGVADLRFDVVVS